MNVLSLFDGMSCGQIALARCGIDVDNYYAAEIDKYAMSIVKKNYPNTVHLGDVCDIKGENLPPIDLLLGGSPCQGFSFAGKQLNFDDPRSALFFEYVRILKETKPRYFLMENVRMKQEYQDMISEHLGVKPVMINSSLVSAQNRVRLYWTNIPNIEQPKDKGIVLKDILEDDVTEPMLSNIYGGFKEKKPRIHTGKSVTIRTASGGGHIPSITLKIKEATKKGYTEIDEGDCFDLTFPNSKTRRGRNMKSKCNCLTAANYDYMVFENKSATKKGKAYALTYSYTGAVAWNSIERKQRTMVPVSQCDIDDPNVVDGYHYRKLTPMECERLQTVPDGYTEGVSNTQRYKMLGNGWTVDVISHILKNI